MKKQKIILFYTISIMVVLATVAGIVYLSQGNGPTQMQYPASTGVPASLSAGDAQEPPTTTGETDAVTQPSQSLETKATVGQSNESAESEVKPTKPTESNEPTSKPNSSETKLSDKDEDDDDSLPGITWVPSGSATGVADPKTGISWDGKSPIIYTYPDGSTGTVPKDGATYESVPGIITTYKVKRDSAGREVGTSCDMCGKEVSNQSKGKYCTQFSHDTFCEYCGAHTKAYTCHTCKNYNKGTHYCNKCGRVSGSDGSDGKCVRWMAGDKHTCPSCKETVPSKTCHTCDRN